jgi:hypothetical protein
LYFPLTVQYALELKNQQSLLCRLLLVHAALLKSHITTDPMAG